MKAMPLAEDMNPVRHSEDKEMAASKEAPCQYPHVSDGINDIVNDVVSSYEARIQTIGAIFDTTHQIIEDFQDSFLDTKEEREKVNAELRESLAQKESLRKKDFDHMMRGILSTQDAREKEVRNLLKGYLSEQKEVAKTLRDDLAKVKDALAGGEAERVKEFQALMKGTFAGQDERKNEVTSMLKEFQKEQQEMSTRLKELLAKGRDLRIRDLKLMLKAFKAQHEERIIRREERREEIRSMLSDFNKACKKKRRV